MKLQTHYPAWTKVLQQPLPLRNAPHKPAVLTEIPGSSASPHLPSYLLDCAVEKLLGPHLWCGPGCADTGRGAGKGGRRDAGDGRGSSHRPGRGDGAAGPARSSPPRQERSYPAGYSPSTDACERCPVRPVWSAQHATPPGPRPQLPAPTSLPRLKSFYLSLARGPAALPPPPEEGRGGVWVGAEERGQLGRLTRCFAAWRRGDGRGRAAPGRGAGWGGGRGAPPRSAQPPRH